MKVMFCAYAAISLSLVAPSIATAATQGSLSTGNSTGSITVTLNGPALARQVQVTGLTDPIVNNASRSEYDSSVPGVTTTFCLVDTHSGSLALAASVGSLATGGWALESPGYVVPFRIAFTKTDNSFIALTPTNSISTPFIQLPAGVSVTSAGACGAGTIKAHVFLPDGEVPASSPARTYTATVQIVLSPQ